MKNVRKKWTKRLVSSLAAAALITTSLLSPASAWRPAPVYAADSSASVFVDVPGNSWAIGAIGDAKDLGLMTGQDSTHFGYGKPVTKAEFVTILCNMFKWDIGSPIAASFSDVANSHWAYSYVETALSHSVMSKTSGFAPDTAITREEAAVMLVNALGLSAAAALEDSAPLPFTDVNTNKGYIAVAKNIGMISGSSATTFNPKGTALREEVASMLTKVYSKYNAKTDFLHGFYAISSYSQKELTKDMDAVTLMWSAMTMENGTPKLSTGSDNGTQFTLPDSYESMTSYLDSNGTNAHLGVYMTVAGGAGDLLGNAVAREAAVNAIVNELTKNYDAIGKNPYSGVTIDFEGLKGAAAKEGLNDFLTALSNRLKAIDKTLYVAVQPVLPDGMYYDGFDYRTIGNLADKVILMAHDYNPTSLDGFVGTEYYKNAALTPIAQVYFALKAAADPATGVMDHSKLALAISFAGMAWQVDENGKLVSPSPVQVSPQTISTRLQESGTISGYSATYRNPYLTYKAPDGKNYFVWYENSQSVSEKAALARLFSIDGISLWRLGNIPNYNNYNVTNSYQ